LAIRWRSRLPPGNSEAAQAVDLRFLEEVQQVLEFRFRLARETGDEGRADGQVRIDGAPGLDAVQVFSPLAGRFMRFSTSGCACCIGMSR
jgi:hypothetical protein